VQRLEAPARRATARIAAAAVVYTIGGLGCLAALVSASMRLAEHPSPGAMLGPLAVLVPWWITAGLGVRLGMTPRTYARGVASFLGF
jgi:hypothetical protein